MPLPQDGFNYPMTLTCFHFAFTVVFYRLLAAARCFQRSTALPVGEGFKVAAMGVGSIGLMNVSLNTNSVGFYQLTKLAIVPCTLCVQAALFGTYASRKVQLSIAILLGGLAMATVTDVHLNALGFCLGVAAILTTTVFQLWQGSKQREYELSPTQLQARIAGSQALQSFAAALGLEGTCHDPPRCRTSIAAIAAWDERPSSGWLVLLTCFTALIVNFSSFGLIGRTSAVSFQVVGHAKTCLVLTGGYLLWPPADRSQLSYHACGVSIALCGCFLYGHLKMAEASSRADLLDRICPSPVLRFLVPHSYEALELPHADAAAGPASGAPPAPHGGASTCQQRAPPSCCDASAEERQQTTCRC